jgi:hypothetical protein
MGRMVKRLGANAGAKSNNLTQPFAVLKLSDQSFIYAGINTDHPGAAFVEFIHCSFPNSEVPDMERQAERAAGQPATSICKTVRTSSLSRPTSRAVRHTPAAGDTNPRASRWPTFGAAASCCRTPPHTTPETQILTVQYPWHPFHGQQVSVMRHFCKQGIEVCRCASPGRIGLPSLEIPAWMFARAHCALMRSARSAHVNLQALVDLQRLLHDSTSSSVGMTQPLRQSEAQPKPGDTDDDQTQAPEPSRSLRVGCVAAPVGEVTPNKQDRTHSVAQRDAAQSASPPSDSADSERRRP